MNCFYEGDGEWQKGFCCFLLHSGSHRMHRVAYLYPPHTCCFCVFFVRDLERNFWCFLGSTRKRRGEGRMTTRGSFCCLLLCCSLHMLQCAFPFLRPLSLMFIQEVCIQCSNLWCFPAFSLFSIFFPARNVGIVTKQQNVCGRFCNVFSSSNFSSSFFRGFMKTKHRNMAFNQWEKTGK